MMKNDVQINNDKHLNEVILQNESLVRNIVRQYHAYNVDPEDLMQEGRIGVMQAYRHFDPTKGVTLQSYAAWWIRKYICERIRLTGYIIKMPRTNVPEKIITEELHKIVAIENDEVLTYEDVLRSRELAPDEQMEYEEAMQRWREQKNALKITKKRFCIGKIIQNGVNK